MKRLPFMVVILFLASTLLGACAPKAPLKITVATDATFPPFESVNLDSKQVVGLDIDIMKAIADRANFEITWANASYESLLAGMAKCQYDAAISAIPITVELKQQMYFSDTYYAAGQVIVVKKGNTRINGRDTLANMTVGAQQKTSSATEIGNIPGVKFRPYFSFELAFNDLIFGTIDAVVADKPMAMSYVGKPANNLKLVGDEFAVEEFGIAVCNKKDELLKPINDALASLKGNGTLAKLIDKWVVKGGDQAAP